MRAWTILPTFVALVSAAIGSAQSPPVFEASANGCGFDTQTANVGVEADQPVAACSANSMDGAHAEAGPGGLGVTAEHWHYCCATASGAGGTASVQTEFFISGPPGAVTFSLNLAAHGVMATDGIEDFAESTIRIDVVIAGVNQFLGLFRETSRFGEVTHTYLGALAPGPFTCSGTCAITTPTVTVATNTWIPMSISLAGSAGGGTGNNEANVRASDTLYFPIGSPVFNLPEGYSARIPAMNVEDNQVVPEPASAALLGSGIVALAAAARRRSVRSA